MGKYKFKYIVKSLIEKSDLTTRQEIEKLILGETIEKPIHEDITYDEIYKNMDNLWNFMFFTGYFKKVNQRMDSDDSIRLTLKIPNKEVKYIFKNKILDWFSEKIKVKDLSVLYNAIINGDAEIFQKELRKLLRETISFNDAYENFYHGFVVGVLMNMSDYIIKSNYKEAPRQENEVGFHTKLDTSQSVQCQGGTGRSDVYIKSPSVLEKAVIIEFKVADNIKQLDAKCNEAIGQIKLKEYDMDLRNEGYEDIIQYGIAFYKKDCMIKLSK